MPPSPDPRFQETVTAPPSPAIARRLGQYDLEEPLGRGGMGVVWKARHRHLGQTVAVKFLTPESWSDPQAVARFYQEMRAAGRVVHPNLVRALDAGEIDGHHLLVMECLDGLTVRDVLDRVRTLPVAAACEIIRQAAAGVSAISHANLVHRDLKPSNLFLTSDGVVKVMDLGLAKISADAGVELTGSHYLMGTIDYISPEQSANPRDVDVRADLYSLGCTLFALLSGHAPFHGEQFPSMESKLRAHREQPPPPLSSFNAGLPPELQAIVDRLLAKNPDDRVQSPEELERLVSPLAAGSDLVSVLKEARRKIASRTPQAEGLRSQTSWPISKAGVETSKQPPPETATPAERNRERRRPASVPPRTARTIVFSAIALGVAVAALAAASFLPDRARNADPSALTPEAARPRPSSAQEPRSTTSATAGPASAKPLPMQWEELLTADPEIVFWDRSDEFAEWKFDPRQGRLTVANSNRGMFLVREVQENDFMLQIGMHQSHWSGGCCIFMGLTGWDGNAPEAEWHCLEFAFRLKEEILQRPEVRNGLVPKCEVIVSEIRSSLKEGTRRQVIPRAFASDTLEQPDGEARLEITVRDGRLDVVKFEGASIPNLVKDIYGESPQLNLKGGFGIAVNGGAVTFMNCRIKRLSPRP